jgi:hypothetical protein
MTPRQFDAFCAAESTLGHPAVANHTVEKVLDLRDQSASCDRKGVRRRPPRTPRLPHSAQNPRLEDRPPPDLLAEYEYDSAGEVDYYRLNALSKRAAQWLVEHPPEGPEHNTVSHRRAGAYFLAASGEELRIRVS